MNKDNYLLNLVIAAAAITTTLYLLNKYLNKNNGQSTHGPADAYNNTDMPTTSKYVDKMADNGNNESCFFPDSLMQTYRSKYAQADWGEINPGSPDIANNNF